MAKPKQQPSDNTAAAPDDTNLSNESAPAVAPDTAGVGNEPLVISPEEPAETPATASVDDTIAGENEAPASSDEPAEPVAPSQPAPVVEPRPATFAPVNSFADDSQSAMSSVTTETPAKRHYNRRWLAAVIVVIVLLLVIAGTALAYVAVYLPSRPQNVIAQSLANTLYSGDLSSANFNGASTITDKTTKSSYAVTYSGKFNKNGAFDVQASVDAAATKVSLELLSVNGQDYYVKASGLDGLPQLLTTLTANDPTVQADAQELQALTPALTAVNGQWYEINQSLVRTIEQNLGIDQNNLRLSQSDADKIANLYKQHQFLVVDRQLPDQTVAGVSSYHYKLHVDNAQLKTFLSGLQSANISVVNLKQSDIASLTKTDLAKYPFELWISHGSKLIDQAKLNTDSPDATTLSQLTLSKLNQPVSISAPTGAQSVLQLLDQLYSAISGGNVNTSQLSQLFSDQ